MFSSVLKLSFLKFDMLRISWLKFIFFRAVAYENEYLLGKKNSMKKPKNVQLLSI